MLGILRIIDLGTFNNFNKVTLYYFFRPKVLAGSNNQLMNDYFKFYQDWPICILLSLKDMTYDMWFYVLMDFM